MSKTSTLRMAEGKETKRRITHLFADRVDAALKDGHWEWCDALCDALTEELADIEELAEGQHPKEGGCYIFAISTLIYTLGAKRHLTRRQALFDQIQTHSPSPDVLEGLE